MEGVIRRIERLLIANRGEIAVRIARTCRAMGITSIAVYSDADEGALHTQECDEAVRIGSAPARESYLSIDNVIAAVRESRADAVHPGYGFLSENARFAQACLDAGVIFVGPPLSAMQAVGDKIAAKRIAAEVGVPTVPGYLGEDQTIEAFTTEARRIGTPLIVKAAAGGGGKGMRLVRDAAQLRDAIEGAQREARSAFGDATVFLERYLESPRHVEVQILGDRHGAYIHLNERDCSIQRRHQKIVEETPSPAVTAQLRDKLGSAALAIAKAVGYQNAGTVEFMLDANGEYYFLEVNARLQVEHPVTEMVTGTDLVREQIEIAAGAALGLRQKDVAPRGHAIEVRIYAEDPANGFLPSSGRVLDVRVPSGPGIRVDEGITAGSIVTTDYDPMLAKLIAHGESRAEALGRLQAALHDCHVAGVATNVEFLRWLVREPDFVAGKTATDFLDKHHWTPAKPRPEREVVETLAAAGALQSLGSWRLGSQARTVRFSAPAASVQAEFDWRTSAWMVRDGQTTIAVRPLAAPDFELTVNGRSEPLRAWRTDDGIELALGDPPLRRAFALDALEDVAHAGAHASGQGGSGSATAPMSGTVVKVDCELGAQVKAHQVLAVIEAMKMEHAIAAPFDGRVQSVNVRPGDRVDAGDVLIEVEPAA